MFQRLARSVLYVPASKERALEKARGLACDAIIFDLEDAVAIDEKIPARNLLAKTLLAADYGDRLRIVRVNALDTAWGREDVLSVVDADAVLLPKVNSAADVDAIAALTTLPIWAMMETPLGILNASEIGAHPRLEGMVIGTNDLAKDLNARYRSDREPLLTSLQMCLLAARAHGFTIVDGVYNAFKDDAGLKLECDQGRDMGFDGKTLIHPAQLVVANTAFAPSNVEVDLSKRQIEAFEQAERDGLGVAVVDGKIVENLHIVTARATLAKAQAIEAMKD